MDVMKRGVILGVYCFVIIIAYVFISGPFEDFMSSFENINASASDSYVEDSVSYGRLVFDMSFAILLMGPVVWFIFDSLKREPDWRY
jgi:hypothetical protein